MKTLKVFGRNISLGVVVLAVLAMSVTAVLVTYLSNTTTVTVNVQSPLLTEASLDGGATWASGTVPLGVVYGGDTIQFQMRVINRANATINGDVVTDFMNTATNNICSDYTTMEIEDPAGSGNWTDVSGICANSGPASQAEVSVPGTWLPFETGAYSVRITYDPAVSPDNYSIATNVVV